MNDKIEKKRLHSLDAFRGLTIAAMIVVNTPGDGDHVFAPLKHSEWNGCTPTDIVFPCFIFMMGISVVFAFSTKRLDPAQHMTIIAKAFRRMLIIIAIGLGLQLIYRFNFSILRFPGVLQRIGVVYFISTLLYIKLSERALKYILAAILVCYYLLVCVLPAEPLNAVSPTQNMNAWFDHLIIPSAHLAKFAYTDPCGLLGTIPTIGTAIIGMLAGLVLKHKTLQPETKALRLIIGGNLLILAGLFANLVFPFNKPLWSSSYVLYAGGICTVGFAIFYWLIDIKGIFKQYWPLTVLGINAISAYVLSEALPALVGRGTRMVDHGLVKVFTPEWASFGSALAFLLLVWAIMYVLYKKQWIIKI